MPVLLVVTDTTPARGGDLHLLPRLPEVDPTDRGPFDVRLVLPDGTTEPARAVIDIPHVRGPGRPLGMVRLLGRVGVPAGTRVER